MHMLFEPSYFCNFCRDFRKMENLQPYTQCYLQTPSITQSSKNIPQNAVAMCLCPMNICTYLSTISTKAWPELPTN